MSYYNIDDKKMDVIKEKLTTEIQNYFESSDENFIKTLISPGESQNELLELITNVFIKAEFEIFMGYAPYQRTDAIKTNYRNGSHNKSFKTTHGEISLKIPEDRNSEFYPSIVSKYQSRSEELTNSLLNLFKLGLSNKEVVEFMNSVYGNSYSPQNISKITEVLLEIVDEFKTRQIREKYFAIFIDATYIPIRFDGTYEKQALYIVCGITHDGYQEIIGYTIGFSENTTLWSELLEDLHSRGLKEVDIFIMDGAKGVPNVVKNIYPNSDIQICTVHIMRNLLNKIASKDKASVAAEIKNIFLLNDYPLILNRLSALQEEYPRYSKLFKNLSKFEYLFTYLKYPPMIHKAIKSTNRIEAVNQKIKTRIAHKRSFPNRESLEKILVATILELNNTSTRKVNGMEAYISYIK